MQRFADLLLPAVVLGGLGLMVVDFFTSWTMRDYGFLVAVASLGGRIGYRFFRSLRDEPDEMDDIALDEEDSEQRLEEKYRFTRPARFDTPRVDPPAPGR